MKLFKLMMIVSVCCVISLIPVLADDAEGAPAQKMDASEKGQMGAKTGSTMISKVGDEATHLAAEVAIPNLSAEMAKKIAYELSQYKEIKSVKPDMEAGTLLVTYDKDFEFKADPFEKILRIEPKAKIKGIVKTKAPSKDKCGGCPHREKCAGSEKKSGEDGKALGVKK